MSLSSEYTTDKKPKKDTYKIGDKVKFFDEQNREFPGTIEKVNLPITEEIIYGVAKKIGPITNANIRVSRLMGHSQIYLSVPFTSDKKTKCRYN